MLCIVAVHGLIASKELVACTLPQRGCLQPPNQPLHWSRSTGNDLMYACRVAYAEVSAPHVFA